MSSTHAAWRSLSVIVLLTLLAGCNPPRDPGYQGWVEADMIFVSPDESGRVTRLNVREGDEVKSGSRLYAIDDDLQQANLNQNKATLANAQQNYDRAASLSKTGSGTQATLDAAVSALRSRSPGRDLGDASCTAYRLCTDHRHRAADLLSGR